MPVRVLIVDDHASFRWLARLLLVVAGFEVIGEAADAGGAGELVERLHPDAVLLDVMLPDGSWVEVARELERWANVSVAICGRCWGGLCACREGSCSTARSSGAHGQLIQTAVDTASSPGTGTVQVDHVHTPFRCPIHP